MVLIFQASSRVCTSDKALIWFVVSYFKLWHYHNFKPNIILNGCYNSIKSRLANFWISTTSSKYLYCVFELLQLIIQNLLKIQRWCTIQKMSRMFKGMQNTLLVFHLKLAHSKHWSCCDGLRKVLSEKLLPAILCNFTLKQNGGG